MNRGTGVVIASAVASAFAVALARRGRNMITGKGVFGVGGLTGTQPFYSWVKLRKYKWLSPQGFVQFEDKKARNHFNPKTYFQRTRLAREHGASVIPWCWPVPGQEDDFVARARELVRLGCRGIVIDPEDPYYTGLGSKRPVDVNVMALRGLLNRVEDAGIDYVVATYGGPPSWHPGFPWDGLVDAPAFLPMLYKKQTIEDVGNTIAAQQGVLRGRPIPLLAYRNRDLFRAARKRYGTYAVWTWQEQRAQEAKRK